MQYLAGWIEISLISLYLLFNLFLIFKDIFKDIYLLFIKYKRRIQHRFCMKKKEDEEEKEKELEQKEEEEKIPKEVDKTSNGQTTA